MSGVDTVVILQARMASTRLPGKALAPIDGRSLLRRCLDRLILSGVGPVLLATTTNHEDEALAAEAIAAGALVFRGSSDNVLQRFVLAARSVGARVVIRATADNPAVDVDAPARVLAALEAAEADHAVDVGLPVGCAVEAAAVDALERALTLTADPFDLEHVTPMLRRDRGHFRAVETPAPPPVRRPDLRLTVDTAADLRFVRAVLARRDGSNELPLAEIIAAADEVGAGAAAS